MGNFSAKTTSFMTGHFNINIISHVLDNKHDNFFILNNGYAFVGTIVDDDGIIDEFGSS